MGIVVGTPLRVAVCGVSGIPLLRSLAGVAAVVCGCATELLVVAVLRFTGEGMVPPLVVGTAAELLILAARLASSGMLGRWLKGRLETNGCPTASDGLSLRSGSQRKHRLIKSMNASSSVLSACCRVLELGRLRLPLLETVTLGLPTESKNSFFLVQRSTRCRSGGPNISIIQASCSCSFSPGKIG